MENFREKQKREALIRLKLMDIYPDAIQQFKNRNAVMVSERPYGALYELSAEQKEMVTKFEKEHNALVYIITHTFTEFGELYELFYVSDSPDEWEMDKNDILEGYSCVYVNNIDDEYSSEFGSIGIKPVFGGLVRTA